MRINCMFVHVKVSVHTYIHMENKEQPTSGVTLSNATHSL